MDFENICDDTIEWMRFYNPHRPPIAPVGLTIGTVNLIGFLNIPEEKWNFLRVRVTNKFISE